MACIARLGVTPQIKREFKRRAAIEPVIGHLKEHHRMGRNHLAHASGDAINAVLAAAGYNFRRLLAWLRLFLLRILIALGLALLWQIFRVHGIPKSLFL